MTQILIVLAESASECVGNVLALTGKAMYGSNHFSMRNDQNTQLRLHELYDGLHGEYFINNER